ncbi:MAG: hypothetical protein C4524_00625 [Candidatus Zixiibacteriota bacterium]|nr:MAG: hypothetical protein C4524_00625 [candidate division Zixibacteria bacterium]
MNRRRDFAWLGLCLALGLHVAEEAATGFPAFFNRQAAALREWWPGLPLPDLAPEPWLAAMLALTAVLTLPAVRLFQGRGGMTWFSRAFAVIMMVIGAAWHLLRITRTSSSDHHTVHVPSK